ncbi:MAG: hypothetical protein R2771_11720 [Saprospiraceae bacterium]
MDESEVTLKQVLLMILSRFIDTVELIMEFENEFNLSIPDDQAENPDCRGSYQIH